MIQLLPRWTRPASLALLVVQLCACDDAPADPAPPGDAGWKVAFDATDGGWLLNVWGSSAADLHAVGGTPTQGRIVHFDGAEWRDRELAPNTPLLTWAHGFSADDVTCVGNAGTVLHWDGIAHTRVPTPTEEDLWGVWGARPDALWAVGGAGRAEGQATLLKWDGVEWTRVSLPLLQRPRVYALFKVWGSAEDDVWVVGQRGVVLHWDGVTWSEVLVGASEDLISIWGTDRDHVVAVGGRMNGIVSRWDGTTWETRSLAPLPGLNGVSFRTPDVIHVVGVGGTIARLDFASLSLLDEQKWETSLDLHAAFVDDGGTLTAVGGSFAHNAPPYEGIALQRKLSAGE
jgi:hypothetical protein